MSKESVVSSLSSSWLELDMAKTLARRAEKGSLRVYQEWKEDGGDTTRTVSKTISTRDQLDFSSNDYLGLARDVAQQELVERRYQCLLRQQEQQKIATLGSTGSRLLSGDSNFARRLEHRLSQWHNRPAALLFNSGYDANLSVLACLPCDTFVFDEYAHNSLRMGMRLSQKFQSNNRHEERNFSFQHNNVDALRQKLIYIRQTQPTARRIIIVVESVYSMDGDVAPLQPMLDLALSFDAMVVVDEAHGIGIFGNDHGHHSRGTGVLAQLKLEHHPALVCSIHTFGKAAGCHGAVVCGSETLRQYLWNYGWPLIYSTSLPLHSLVAIECSYETMTSPRGKALRQHTQTLVDLFRRLVQTQILNQQRQSTTTSSHHQPLLYLLPSTCPIQALVLPHNGNQACTQFCQNVWELSQRTLRLYPIKSPTVPAGKERVRIILHGHNSPQEVCLLVEYMRQSLVQMKLLPATNAVETEAVTMPPSRL